MPRSLVALIALTLLSQPAGAMPLAGRWDGVFHGGRGDEPATLILRAGPGGTLSGLLYKSGDLMGPLENGRLSGDSLHFAVMNFACRGQRTNDQLTVELSVTNGRSHEFSFHFTNPDTAALVPSAEALAAARARNTVDWGSVPDSVFAAHRLADSVAVGPSAATRAGTLFLVGGGPAQDDLNAEFARLAGGATGRIVVIPTASLDPDQPVDTLLASRWAQALGVAHVTLMHARTRREADSEEFVKPLRTATGVWLPGGEAGRILVNYLGTRTERELLAVLARGGVIGGTSAGALVWGSECQTFQAPADGSPYQMGDASRLKVNDPHAVAFGALRQVVIAPHYTAFRMQSSLAKSVAARPQLLGLGIDEATALEVHGNEGKVLGRGHVYVRLRGKGDAVSEQVLNAGDRFDLARKAAL